jgi:hypothetical protein
MKLITDSLKNLFIVTFAFLFIGTLAVAQTPQKISYQSIVRDASGKLVTNHSVSIKISILQGSTTGTAVYAETQAPRSNANGLVSMEIGNGTVVSGSIASINWANGPYFIKTETDPAGGVSYTIIGTSQLLSIPYALYADKAGNGFSGNYNDLNNKPIIDGSETKLTAGTNISITGSGTTGSPYKVGVNQPLADGSETKLTAGTNISVTGSGTTVSPYVVGVNQPLADGSETKLSAGTNISITGSGTTGSPYVVGVNQPHYPGKLFGGGVVFWVDHTCEHGLIVSMVDLSVSQTWSNITSTLIGTTSDWDGATNTAAITSQGGHTSSAAKLCADYTNTNYGTGIYSDWYLPSVAELNHIWNNFYEVQKALTNDGNAATIPIARSGYWSSSECSYDYAWPFDFYLGGPYFHIKTDSYSVRAVRAF